MCFLRLIKISSVFLIVFFLFLGGCATAPKRSPIQKEGLYLKDLCSRFGVLWQWDSVSRVITLKGNDIEASLLVGSEIVIIKDKKISLSGPIKIVDSLIVVPLDFKDKVMLYFSGQTSSVRRGEYTLSKAHIITIDPGHGGKDPGAISRNGLQEKDVVLDIAKRLRNILKGHGFKVIMTRSTDEFISLNERTEIASRSKADIFISIHANSSPARKVYGIEIYTLKNLGYLEKNEDQRKTNHNILFKKLAMDENDLYLDKIVSDMLYTNKQAESIKLAEVLAQNAQKVLDIKNRGIKTSRFFVLRNTLSPAVLVEVGFLTNSKEERHMKTSSYRQKIAYSLAKGVLEFSGSGQ